MTKRREPVRAVCVLSEGDPLGCTVCVCESGHTGNEPCRTLTQLGEHTVPAR